MKSDNLLEEIKSKTDIVDFISEFIQLKKAGQNYRGLCPFHAEKTPSFMVSQSKQIFHCFGCGTGGDVVTFLMKHDKLSFADAIRHMAKRAGIELREFRGNRPIDEKRERLLRINKEAAEFFAHQLRGSDTAKGYLKKRGIDTTSVEKFRIGYARTEWNSIYSFLKKKGFSDAIIMDSGLAKPEDRGYRDVFRGRIIFPIFNLQNEVIAFGGRSLDASLPKYLNTHETEIFKKGETLFALNIAKEELRKKEYALIVEGYLDAIVCHQYGFGNTVAPLGTALTSKQLQKLKILTEQIVLVFDSDDAGIAAARRSLALMCESGYRSRVLLLPPGEDPDSFLRKHGSQSFQKLLTETYSMIAFLLKTTKTDKINTVREALGMISSIDDLIMAEDLLMELSEKAHLNESVLRNELKKLKSRPGNKSTGSSVPEPQTTNREEHLLLSAVISHPEKAFQVLSRLDTGSLKEKAVKSLFLKIHACTGHIDMAALLENADDSERALITSLSVEPGFDPEYVDRNIEDCLLVLTQKQLEEKRKLADESGDITLLNQLLKEKRKLLKGEPS
jgi:DNA primase